MQNTQGQLLITIIAVILVLLFLGFLFLLMLFYYNNKKKQMVREQEALIDLFEKQLLQSKLEIREHTFNMISQEIHDNVGQVLSLAKIQIHILDQRDLMDKELLRELKENISHAITDLRDISKSLSSDKIRSFKLLESIEHEVLRINKTGFIAATLTIEGDEFNIPEQKKLILFRIIQESLQNILKHANASNINVCLQACAEDMNITIADDGTGFDVAAKKENNTGLGLTNMINRALLIGGKIDIVSADGLGTKLIIKLPYA